LLSGFNMSSPKPKKQLRQIIYSVLALTLLFSGGYLLWKWKHPYKVIITRYPEFGIAIPENYSIHGIDVSRYQEMIIWEEVKKMKVKNIQLGFSFIKATEGIGSTDPRFNRNWKKAKENEMVRGAYHFFIASKDGKMQAENFISKVKLESGDLPPVLDIEQLNGTSVAELQKEAKKWLEVVENYYKIKPIIYTNVDFYDRNLGSEFDKYPLWAAHYYQADQPRINRSWVFWQHSDEGSVNGISSKVDFDVFNGDSSEFRNLLFR
jgi:lysozyme